MSRVVLPEQFREIAVSEVTDDMRAQRSVVRGSRREWGTGYVCAFRASTGEVLTGDTPTSTEPTRLLRDLLGRLETPEGEYRAVWGYGSVFDVGYMYRDMFGPYVEVMNRYAFERSLGLPELQTSFLRSHSGLGLATTRAGRMAIGTDDHGLGFAAYLNMAEDDARELVHKLESGSATTDTSVGGSIEASQWNDDYTELEIYEWSLSRGEISSVMAGANPAGWVTLAGNSSGSPDVDHESLAEVIAHKELANA